MTVFVVGVIVGASAVYCFIRFLLVPALSMPGRPGRPPKTPRAQP